MSEVKKRFTDDVKLEIKTQIKNADGNEVFFIGFINEEGVVVLP